jgi:hypothetical protein
MTADVLTRHGLVPEQVVAEALALQRRESGSLTLGECLVRLGAVDEDTLVDFFHSRLMIPRIEDARLQIVSPKVLSLVPADMAAEFRVLPVDVDAEGTLTLAMSEPTNNHAVDEVAFFTNRFVVRGAARITALRRAIEQHYRVTLAPMTRVTIAERSPSPRRPPDTTRVERPRRMTVPGIPTHNVPTQSAQKPPIPESEPVVLLTRVKSSDETPLPRPMPVTDSEPIALTRPKPAAPPPVPKPQPAAPTEDQPILLTKPKRASPPPLPDDTPPHRRDRHDTLPGVGKSPGMPDPPLGALRTAGSRDEVALLLLDYMSQLCGRVILFVVKKSLLVGHEARGEKVDPVAVQALAVNMEASSIFHDVVVSRLPYRGPLPMTSTNRAFALAIGGVGGEILVMPIAVRDRIIAVLYADGLRASLPEAGLHSATSEAGLAYERLILNQKR